MWGNGRLLRACLILLLSLLPVGLPVLAEAGCGCNKPPPKPAALIPSFAASGMKITFFDPRFQPGQVWQAVFTGGGSSASTTAAVVRKRDITDPSGKTVDNQLVVVVPKLPPGPASIELSYRQETLAIAADSFVVIGNPVMVSEQNSEQEFPGYRTAVGEDGTLYLAVGGLNRVCDPMRFQAQFDSYPLRFSDGDALIFNWQGYFIDSLTPASHNHFSIQPSDDDSASDILFYLRHSFQQYCAAHRPGGPKQVDPTDPNWHLDGTPHVDYSTVIFAIAGHLSDGSNLTPGIVSATLNMETSVGAGDDRGNGNGTEWQREKPEEGLSGK